MHEWQQAELAQFGEVPDYLPSDVPRQHDIVYPTSHARLKMLTEFVDNDSVYLYIDSDTLIFENLDKLISQFIDSGKPIAIGVEDIEEFWRMPASYAWRDHKIPEEFHNQDKWRNAPITNAGVLLAQGEWIREFGETAIGLYKKYDAQVWLAEQTILLSLLYDREIPFMKLPPKYNCFAWENCITHMGTDPKYRGTRPFFRGESVAIRHFAGNEADSQPCKIVLNKLLPSLDTNAKIQSLLKSSPA